jgi:hypothetical protein
MIERYTRPEMGAIWTEENKLVKWLEVELLACEALAERGEVPKQAASRLRHAGARLPAALLRPLARSDAERSILVHPPAFGEPTAVRHLRVPAEILQLGRGEIVGLRTCDETIGAGRAARRGVADSRPACVVRVVSRSATAEGKGANDQSDESHYAKS